MTRRTATRCAATAATGLVALAGAWGASTGVAGAIVSDTTPPVITVPADITMEATASQGAAVTYTASAADAVDGPVTPTCLPASGQTFPLGATVVTCTATDMSSNTAMKTFNVTVKDTTPPAITVPADMTVAPKSAAGAAVTFTATATDLVSGVVTPSCTPASGATFPIGATTVTCSAHDAAANAASKTFKVTVSTPSAPTLTVPADRTVGALTAAGDVVNYVVSATDAIDGTDPVVCTPPSGATFPVGMTTVACTATNSAGKASSKSFLVTVLPPDAPVVPAKIKVTSARTSSNLATIALTCTGDDTESCDFTAQLVGSTGTLSKKRSLTLYGGDPVKTVRVRLTKAATATLRKHHRLVAELTLKQTRDDGSVATVRRRLVFKH